MLCTNYRIWARRSGEDASKWMEGLNKTWIANGHRKFSEGAAYDIALSIETASNNPDNIDITLMDDLEKGFEKVVHKDIEAKAKVYKYPLAKLRLALSMYTAERRIRCGKAFSFPVTTKIGVLAGCPLAMSLLLFAVLDPVEDFWKRPLTCMVGLKVYVDDFALSFRFSRKTHTNDMIRMKVANAYRAIEKAINGSGANFAKGKGKIVASDMCVANSIADELNNQQDKIEK